VCVGGGGGLDARPGYLEGDDISDNEAVVDGDGEEARIGGEADRARLLVRLRREVGVREGHP
jgi:hypothetical protein